MYEAPTIVELNVAEAVVLGELTPPRRDSQMEITYFEEGSVLDTDE